MPYRAARHGFAMLVLFPRPVHQTPERVPEYAAMRPPETITGHARGQTKTEQVHSIGQQGHSMGSLRFPGSPAPRPG